jgi:hypothetical protein
VQKFNKILGILQKTSAQKPEHLQARWGLNVGPPYHSLVTVLSVLQFSPEL